MNWEDYLHMLYKLAERERQRTEIPPSTKPRDDKPKPPAIS